MEDQPTRKKRAWCEQSEENIISLIQKQDKKFKKYCREKITTNKSSFKTARKDLKAGKRKAKNEWLAIKAGEIKKIQKLDPKTMWKAIKEIARGLYGHHKEKATIEFKKKN